MMASFNTESELVQQFQFVNLERNNCAKWQHFFEVDSENGVADVIYCKLFQSWERRTAIGHINPRWVYALRVLPYRRQFTTDEFCQLTSASRSTVQRVLKSYREFGFCDQSIFNGKWIKQKQPQLVAQHIYAYEAKLKNWKRALYQAQRYKDYASASWVVLDDYHSKPAINNIDLFISRNIGLATVSIDNKFRCIYKPKESQPKSNAATWFINAKIANFIS